jgi:hypothetical protein
MNMHKCLLGLSLGVLVMSSGPQFDRNSVLRVAGILTNFRGGITEHLCANLESSPKRLATAVNLQVFGVP